MKPLLRFCILISLICLQSCGGSMIKNKTDDSTAQKSSKTGATGPKIPVPKATANLVIGDEKDLTGYWVGSFEPDTTLEPFRAGDRNVWDYVNKINISIDEIKGDSVNGHSVVAGNFRPFKGTIERGKNAFNFKVKEPGDDKYDGAFEFSVNTGDSVLNGRWKANGKLKISHRKYALTKKLFRYGAENKLRSGPFVDWDKKKAKHYKDDEMGNYVDTAYFMTSEDLYKYNSSTDELTKQQVANLKKADIFIMRNSIFARHGYSFKKQPLRVYFDEQSWYIPISTDVKSDLTALEKKNLALLVRYEKNAKDYYDTFGR